jgi:hypothetical protein
MCVHSVRSRVSRISLWPLFPDYSVLKKTQDITAKGFVRAPGIRGEALVKFARQRPNDFSVNLRLDDFSEKLESEIVYL